MGSSGAGGEEFLLDNFGEDVAEQDVAFLNARSIVRRHAQTNINKGFEFAAGTPGEGEGVHAHFPGDRDGVKDVGGIAAGGNGDSDVAGAAEGLDLARKDPAEAVIIGNGGDGGKICGQGERGKGGPIKGEAADEFRGDVLGVRSAAAIPEEENFVALLERIDQRYGELGKAGKDLRVMKQGALHGDGRSDGVASTTFEL